MRSSIPVVLAATLFVGCGSSMTVQHEASPALNQQNYTTYRVIEHSVGTPMESLIAQTERALRERGYQPAAEGARPDLVVSVKVLVEEADAPTSRAVRPGDRDLVEQNNDPDVEKLVLVMLQDATSMRTLWLGWAHSSTSETDLEQATSEALTSIVARLPTRNS